MPRNPSPAAQVKQTIGTSQISIDYSRPSVVALNGTDRTGHIWGEMVPYGFELQSSFGNKKPLPWRAGANENTVVRFSHDAKVEGKVVKAGAYGLFVALRKGGGTIIFSKDTTSWGSFFYEEANDALRIDVVTETIALTPRLEYGFMNLTKKACTVVLDWEYQRIPFRVEFDTDGIVLAGLRNGLANMEKPNGGRYHTAAMYCLNNEVNLEEGLAWVEASIKIKETFTNQITKAGILYKMGRESESNKFMKALLALPETTDENYYSYGQQLIRQGRYEEAINLFEQLGKKWPESWLKAHGLARIYSAMEKFNEALALEKEALKNAPEANKYFVSRAIKLLEAGLDFNTM